MVGTLRFAHPTGLICLLYKRKICDKLTRPQITSDFQKLRQALRAKIFRFRIYPNQPHNSARLTR